MINYLLQQGSGQARVLIGAKPITSIIAKEEVPDSVKQKLNLILEIRNFAFDSLGLKPNNNYTTFFDQRGKPLLWVVTACPPFELKSKEWHFPIIGNVSYKGFFDLKKAEIEIKKLESQGFEAEISEVSAWSTLGWFKDPVLSSMLERNEGSLANMIIHELTHGTLFVADDVEFYENLASFIGDLGAIKFLEHKYGKDSKHLKTYINRQSDYQKYSNHMIKGAKHLNELYESENFQKLSLENRIFEKRELMTRILCSADTLKLHNKREIMIDQTNVPKNTRFVDLLNYRSKQDELKKLFLEQHDGNFVSFMNEMKQNYLK
ncbi:MAG: aminopeptidase [Cytophagales bacterium]